MGRLTRVDACSLRSLGHQATCRPAGLLRALQEVGASYLQDGEHGVSYPQFQ